MRAVIDTNVLLDFWVFEDSRAAPLRAAVETRRIATLRSGACVDELSEVLDRPALQVDAARRCEILRLWHDVALPVERIVASSLACTDRHDQKVLDLAQSAGADWLVTKDKALLKLARRAARIGLRILDPGATSPLLSAAA